MRFLHTADWHLGRIFHGVQLVEDQAYVLQQFLQLVKDVKPDAILLAGDIYDRAVPPTEAVRLLDDTLAELLLGLKTPVIMIAGNHDSPERLGFGNRLLAQQGLHVVGSLPENLSPVILADEHGPVYIAPLPYAEPAMVRSVWQSDAVSHEAALQAMIGHILTGVPAGARKVAVAHAFVAGGLESESERPLSVGGSGAVSAALFDAFHYTALGHLHNSQPAGGDRVLYAGSLLKYSFGEAGQQKGINLVELDAAGTVNVERLSLRPRRDVRCLEGTFAQLLAAAPDSAAREDYLMVTLTDEQPVLDARSRLNAVYPNLLDFDYSRLNRSGELKGPASDHRRLNEGDLFAAFFEQMTGDRLAAEQEQSFRTVLDELYRELREVKS